MIKITDSRGKVHWLAPTAIAKISEAGESSKWHGTNCYVKTFDGQTIEARDSHEKIAAQVEQQP